MPKIANELERDNARRVKAIRALIKRECDKLGRNDPSWPSRRRQLEAELLKAKPHLADQQHCGLCLDTEDRPRRRVVMPNGVVLFTTWYKVPTTDADLRRAFKEQQWLRDQGSVTAAWSA